jgi:hypothetical protein
MKPTGALRLGGKPQQTKASAQQWTAADIKAMRRGSTTQDRDTGNLDPR